MIPNQNGSGKIPPREVDPAYFHLDAFLTGGTATYEMLELDNGNFANIMPEAMDMVTLAIYHHPDQPWIVEPRMMSRETAARLLEAHGGVVRIHQTYE